MMVTPEYGPKRVPLPYGQARATQTGLREDVVLRARLRRGKMVRGPRNGCMHFMMLSLDELHIPQEMSAFKHLLSVSVVPTYPCESESKCCKAIMKFSAECMLVELAVCNVIFFTASPF